ncbi:MAG: beta-ketoacyl-ACP synthase II [Anaerolineae bacterium]|nr:beta-ketoacyl-ACP synthase II [Anaerolineae bacterium]
MRKRVVITGLGTVNPLGLDTSSTWENLLNGKSGIGEITHFDAGEYKTRIAAEVKGYNAAEIFGVKEQRRLDRVSQFALSASSQALDDCGLIISDENRRRIGAVVGTAIGGMGTFFEQSNLLVQKGPGKVSPFMVPMILPDTPGGMIALNLGIQGPNFAVVTACATGTNAIGEAAEVIRRGQADVMFAGGSEASIIPPFIAGLASMTAMSTNNDAPLQASRPFDLNRDGFVMGEGAAILLLESLDHALSRNAKIYAEITGYGSSNDAYHITAPPDNGSGAVDCMQMSLDNAQLASSEITYINAHGTSTPINDKTETIAIKTVFGEKAYVIPVSSSKSMTGHMMGATGAIEALFCAKAIQTNMVPPTINYDTPDPECDLDYVPNEKRELKVKHAMSNSFGFGGHNATIIISKYQEATE